METQQRPLVDLSRLSSALWWIYRDSTAPLVVLSRFSGVLWWFYRDSTTASSGSTETPQRPLVVPRRLSSALWWWRCYRCRRCSSRAGETSNNLPQKTPNKTCRARNGSPTRKGGLRRRRRRIRRIIRSGGSRRASGKDAATESGSGTRRRAAVRRPGLSGAGEPARGARWAAGPVTGGPGMRAGVVGPSLFFYCVLLLSFSSSSS